jgi:hypothetical protein
MTILAGRFAPLDNGVSVGRSRPPLDDDLGSGGMKPIAIYPKKIFSLYL